MLCKGAESAVLKRCVSGPVDITIEHVDYFASVSYYSISYDDHVESFSHYINLHANLKNVLLHRIINSSSCLEPCHRCKKIPPNPTIT